MPTALTAPTETLVAVSETRELPHLWRAAVIEPATYNADDGTVEVVFTRGASVRRYDYRLDRYYEEELVVTPESVNMERFDAGAIPVLDSHQSFELANVIGAALNGRIANGEGRALVRLSVADNHAGIVANIKAGVLRNISFGYVCDIIEVVEAEYRTDGSPLPLYRVARFTPLEISFVPIPADFNAGTRSEPTAATSGAPSPQPQGYPCTIHRAAPAAHTQELSMPDPVNAAAGTAAQAATTVDEKQVRQAERQRHAEITDLCKRAGLPDMAEGLINSDATIDAARKVVLDKRFDEDQARGNAGPNVTRIQTIQDETTTRRQGMEEALMHRLNPGSGLGENGRQYRAMSVVDMLRRSLINLGVQGAESLTGPEVVSRSAAYGTTSDYTNVLANVMGKSLRNAYEQAAPTYKQWARRGENLRDFKPISVVALSGAPSLLPVNEHGEFKSGIMVDGAETYAAGTAGRIVGFTRQAMINDDLGAFNRLIGAFGAAAARYENAIVYGILTTNGNLADGNPLFGATRTIKVDNGSGVAAVGGTSYNQYNKQTGAPSALQVSSLTTMRTQMRLARDPSGILLNLTPQTLIVPAALEHTAYQLTSASYVPAVQSNVNEFRSGGRTALNPIIESMLDANSATRWYAVADSAMIDTVEFRYLDGFEGPVLDQEVGFDTDGMRFKCRLDFAAKAIDWRGMQMSDGA